MATYLQVRIAGEEASYAAQAAQAAFALADGLEAQLSRFRPDSELSRIAQLGPGEQMRLSEPVLACLELAKRMEEATSGAFSISPSAMKSHLAQPLWSLPPATYSIRCESGRLEFDPGAIGKGFVLDRMGEVLREWDCPAFLLVAGGSSILAGDPPTGTEGWSCNYGNETPPRCRLLANASMSASGQAVQGLHIVDPRSGKPVPEHPRVWALSPTAAESDALSTACMVLSREEIGRIVLAHAEWQVIV